MPRAQVRIVLALCEKLRLRRVVLVGHSDGCLLALLTTALLMERPQLAASVRVCGLVMITPNLTVETVPTSTRLLLQTKLGRQMLRPLLRSEIGEVAIRRAWYGPLPGRTLVSEPPEGIARSNWAFWPVYWCHSDWSTSHAARIGCLTCSLNSRRYDLSKLSREVLELYKTPLRVEGWDRALHEVARLKKDGDVADVDTLLAVVAGVPAAVISGEHDRVVRTPQC